MEKWFIELSFMRSYFEPKRFELLGKSSIYTLLGIQIFKRYVPTSGDAIMKLFGRKHIEYRGADRLSVILDYEKKTRRWEFRHWLGMLLFIGIVFGIQKKYSTFDYIFVTTLFFIINIFPIILQRHNRIRIVNLLNRFDKTHLHQASEV